MTLTVGALFAGMSGLELGLSRVLDVRPAWVSEIDPAASKVLAHRFPQVPNLGDITKVDWTRVERVDVLTGGFPCTDVSPAGKQAGLTPGTRSGLWSEFARAIDVLRPSLVVIENVRGLLSAKAGRGDAPDPDLDPLLAHLLEDSDAETEADRAGDDLGFDDEDMGEGDEPGPVLLRALGAVLGDLADRGYDAVWRGLRAADVGACHGRFRVFILAWPAADASLVGSVRGGSAWGWGYGPAHGGLAVADTDGSGSQVRVGFGGDDGAERSAAVRGDRDGATTDTDGDGLPSVGRIEPVESDADRCGGAGAAWGAYEPAIRRWEAVLGRVAPAPTELGAKGGQRLSPVFVEWMQGLPAGWMTDVPGLSRNDQLKILGNGVVPQQCAAAVASLLPYAGARVAAA